MKKIIYFLTAFICFMSFITCKKKPIEVVDPLAEYAKFGVFKDIFPLKDTINVDLRQGDSTFIETNMGKMWIKITYMYVGCYKGAINGSCPDGGIAEHFKLRLEKSNENLKSTFGLDAFPENNATIKRYLHPCNVFFNSDNIKVFGNMQVQFRNIYPNPVSVAEYDNVIANNGFHTTLTIQKVCR